MIVTISENLGIDREALFGGEPLFQPAGEFFQESVAVGDGDLHQVAIGMLLYFPYQAFPLKGDGGYHGYRRGEQVPDQIREAGGETLHLADFIDEYQPRGVGGKVEGAKKCLESPQVDTVTPDPVSTFEADICETSLAPIEALEPEAPALPSLPDLLGVEAGRGDALKAASEFHEEGGLAGAGATGYEEMAFVH